MIRATQMRYTLAIACRALFCACFACMLCHAQTPTSPADSQRPRRVFPSEAATEPDEVFRVDTDLVTVEAVVTDNHGLPVRNLRMEDFKLYEDGIERPLALFNVEQRSGMKRPVAIVFAIDMSGSVTVEEVERLRAAMDAFTKRLVERPSLFAVMSFGMNTKVLQNFTSDISKINAALVR